MSDVYKIYIYGAGWEYNKITTLLNDNAINILGLITTYKQKITILDNIRCYCIDEIDLNIADYIIIASGDWDGMYKSLIGRGVKHDRILSSGIFKIPWFDFRRYIKVKESKPSILSNTCLGGMVYNELCLEFNSPTIGGVSEGKEYIKFLNKLDEYAKYDMEFYRMTKEADYIYPSGYPVGIINNEIKWIFVHSSDIEMSIEQWNKRRERINFDNLHALMVITNEEDAYEFDNCKIENKLGFFYKKLGLKSVVYLPEWENLAIRQKYGFYFRNYVQDLVTNTFESTRPSAIDWIAFLEKEYYWRYRI